MKILIIIFFLLLVPLAASAQSLAPTGFSDICSAERGFGACIQQLYLFSLGLAALIALFMLILAGYRYMTAAGNSDQVANAKEAFRDAFVGLIIIFVAFILLNLINPDLVTFKDFTETLNIPEIKLQEAVQAPGNATGGGGSGGGEPPTMKSKTKEFNVLEYELFAWTTEAVDPEGSHLTFTFVQESPDAPVLDLDKTVATATGLNAKVRNEFPVPAGTLGTTFIIRVDVSDGELTSFEHFSFTVTGINNRPEVEFQAQQGTNTEGTSSKPFEPGGISLNLHITDPGGGGDGSFGSGGGNYLFGWEAVRTSGSFCSGGLQLFETKGKSPTLAVPKIPIPTTVKVTAHVFDGAHKVTVERSFSIKPLPDGCSDDDGES